MIKLHPVHQEQIVQYIAEFDPSYFLTLNFSIRFQVGRDRALKELKRFINKLNNFLFGRRSNQALKILPVLEMGVDGYNHTHVSENKVKTNWHIHLIIEDPYKRSLKVQEYSFIHMKQIIADIWGASEIADSSYTSRYDGLAWFKTIYDPLGVLQYLYKEPDQLNEDSEKKFNELAVLHELTNKTGIKE